MGRLVTRFRGEAGFTMAAMMGALLVISLFTISALAVAQNDLPLSRKDQDTKQAYAAAEAGIADYFFHLSQDNAFWSKCTGVPQPSAVNQAWNGVGVDPRGNPSKGATSASNRSPRARSENGGFRPSMRNPLDKSSAAQSLDGWPSGGESAWSP